MLSPFHGYPVVGISLSGRSVCAVRLLRRWGASRYQDHGRYGADNLLDPEDNYRNLAAALKHVVRQVAVPGAVLRVALPGPLVRTTVLYVAERPKSRREAEALIAWHEARQTGAGNSRRRAVHCQATGRGDYCLYGIAVDDILYRCLEETLMAESLALEVVEAAATCRFNGLSAPLRGCSGVLLDFADDHWTLLVWEDSGWPLLVKSGWRGSGDPAGEAGRIAGEVFRLLAAIGREGGGDRTESCYMLAERPEEATIIAEALNSMVGVPFRELKAGSDTGGVHPSGLPAALAGSPALEIICVG